MTSAALPATGFDAVVRATRTSPRPSGRRTTGTSTRQGSAPRGGSGGGRGKSNGRGGSGGPRPKGRAGRKAARMREKNRRLQANDGSRWRLHYDIDGPRVRLGILWFLGVMFAMALGRVGLTVVYALTAGAAAAHTARVWRAAGWSLDPVQALGASAAVACSAVFGPRGLGVGVLLLAIVAVGLASQVAEGDRDRLLARTGIWLQTTLPPALAGGSVVVLAVEESWTAIALVLLVSAYETGDYLIGSGSTNAFEGPAAGMVAVVVMAGCIGAAGFPPFTFAEAMLFGSMVGPLALVGQYTATAMLPHARSFAPALRRLDSLLVAAPVFYVVLEFAYG